MTGAFAAEVAAPVFEIGHFVPQLIHSPSCVRLVKLDDSSLPHLRWNRYEGFVNAKFFEEQRREMVATIRAIAEHIAAELGKTALDERVLMAMAKVPRHEFVPVEVQSYAYLNRPIPIGFDKTISQPLMIAVMTDLLELKADDMVLEIGTGLGYQSAVLAELAGTVASLPAALAALSNLLNKRDSRFFFQKATISRHLLRMV